MKKALSLLTLTVLALSLAGCSWFDQTKPAADESTETSEAVEASATLEVTEPSESDASALLEVKEAESDDASATLEVTASEEGNMDTTDGAQASLEVMGTEE